MGACLSLLLCCYSCVLIFINVRSCVSVSVSVSVCLFVLCFLLLSVGVNQFTDVADSSLIFFRPNLTCDTKEVREVKILKHI